MWSSGLDQQGFHDSGALWAMRFHDGRAHLMTSPTAAPAAAAREAGDWVWAHFRLGDVRARAFLMGDAGLPAAALELLEARDERIQFLGEGEWAFGVLADLERDLAGEALDAGRLFFALDDRRLITARLHALRVVDDVRRQAEAGLSLATPVDAVVALIEHFTELMAARVEHLVAQIDVVEDRVLSEPDDLDGRELGPFRRELARHRREFQSLRSALARSRVRRDPRWANPLAEPMRHLTAPIEDLDNEAAGLQDRARLLHEEIDTLINNATNRSVRALTVISTLLIPPTLIVGALGMNVGGIPFAQSSHGFVAASILCLTVSGGAWLLLKRLKLLP